MHLSLSFRTRLLCTAALFLSLALLCGCQLLCPKYPARPITVICPWGEDGGSDLCIRAFSGALGRNLGVKITVENMAGNGGITGHQAIKDAAPNGYTLGLITFELATYKKTGAADLSWEDYIPLCRLNTEPATITVNYEWAKENDITDLKSFISYCRRNPGLVTMGGSSNASVWHIAGGYFMNESGTDITMTTYDSGAADAVYAAAAGYINGVTVSVPEAIGYINSGHLLCLGVMDTERAALLPNVRTCLEQGYDLQYYTQRGLALPKGTDPEIVETLKEACARAVEDEDFLQQMENDGQAVSYLDADEYAAFLEQSAKDVSAAIDLLGL